MLTRRNVLAAMGAAVLAAVSVPASAFAAIFAPWGGRSNHGVTGKIAGVTFIDGVAVEVGELPKFTAQEPVRRIVSEGRRAILVRTKTVVYELPDTAPGLDPQYAVHAVSVCGRGCVPESGCSAGEFDIAVGPNLDGGDREILHAMYCLRSEAVIGLDRSIAEFLRTHPDARISAVAEEWSQTCNGLPESPWMSGFEIQDALPSSVSA